MSMLKNFRTYGLSIDFYKECKKMSLPSSLKDQLIRASSSVSNAGCPTVASLPEQLPVARTACLKKLV